MPALASAARVRASQLSRFCRALDLSGLIDFKLELVASLARADSVTAPQARISAKESRS